MKISMRTVWIGLWLLCCGCGSSPNTTYYTLAAVSGSVRQAPPGAIEVRRPGIPGYLDRTEILAQWDGQRLQLASNAGWAEPITAMIGRVLAEDLSSRMRDTIAFSSSSDLAVPAGTVIDLVIRKFDLSSDGYVHLNALWSVRGTSVAQPVTRASAFQARPVANTDTDGTVAAMSGLLGQLADEIANVLLTLPNSAPAQTPVQE